MNTFYLSTFNNYTNPCGITIQRVSRSSFK